jgi:predicted transcriptional regulator
MNKILAKRITIILDDDLVKKLHEIQAKQIKQSTKSVSFSRVLNEVLRKSLK